MISLGASLGRVECKKTIPYLVDDPPAHTQLRLSQEAGDHLRPQVEGTSEGGWAAKADCAEEADLT